MYILTLLYYGDGSEKRHKISVSLHELRNRGVRVEVGRVWSDIVSLHTYRHKFLLRPFKYTIEKKGGGGGSKSCSIIRKAAKNTRPSAGNSIINLYYETVN